MLSPDLIKTILSSGTGISGELKTDGTAAFRQGTKPLPALNSLVDVVVLDRSGSSFKLQVAGFLFQSSLPLDLKAGELFLAKVISHHPFTLSTGGILNGKLPGTEVLLQMAKKLGLKNTPDTERVIRAVIGEKKALIKSKIEEITDLIEKEGLELSDAQLAALIQYVMERPAAEDKNQSSNASLFSQLPGELTGQIFSAVSDISRRGVHSSAEEFVLNNLTVELKTDNVIDTALLLKDNIRNIMKVIVYLEEFTTPADAKLNKLKNDLLRYCLLKASYTEMHRYPDFIINRRNGSLELIETGVKAEGQTEGVRPESVRTSWRTEINMQPSALGEVRFECIYMQNTMQQGTMRACFTSGSEARMMMEDESGRLQKTLESIVGGKASIEFMHAGEKSSLGDTGERRVNFRI